MHETMWQWPQQGESPWDVPFQVYPQPPSRPRVNEILFKGDAALRDRNPSYNNCRHLDGDNHHPYYNGLVGGGNFRRSNGGGGLRQRQ